jgi:hypothetical protein
MTLDFLQVSKLSLPCRFLSCLDDRQYPQRTGVIHSLTTTQSFAPLSLYKMAPLKLLTLTVVTAGVANAFTPPNLLATTTTSSPASLPTGTRLFESFGFEGATDVYKNQPDLLKGEQEYKQYVNRIKEDNLVSRKVRCKAASVLWVFDWSCLRNSRWILLFLFLSVGALQLQYNVIRRVRELDLLQATVDAGVLSKLEKNGLDLVTVEKLLPLLEEYGLLSLAANNQQLLVNLVAPLLVEGAPLLLPVVAGALEVGPPAFYLASAAFAGLDAYLLATDAEIPFVGLSAGVFLGLILVPLSVASAAAGVALGSLKK